MKSGSFRVLDLQIDLTRQTLQRDSELLELPELSFRLLAALVCHAPHTLSKDALIREVWGRVVVSDETLAQRVRLLRQALAEDAAQPRYISAVRGRGYRLLCAVEELARPVAKLPGLHCIAVLPFTDLSPEKNHRYFADGMQDELLTHLSALPQLNVASRTSVERFRGSELGVPAIARELGVGAVIESSVRVAEARVRITVQLINAQTDCHLWAQTFERELSVANIFALQQEVAESICRSLQLEYAAQPALLQLPTASLAAYDSYLVGRYHTFTQSPGDLQRAIRHLQEAVALDPEFAEAWTALGWAYSFLGTVYGGQAPSEVYPNAKAAVTRALALNSQLANAHSLYGDILSWYDWDFVAAEREYRKAQQLAPHNVLGYAVMLSAQRRHAEAIALLEIRLAATPGDEWVHINAAWVYLHARDYSQAIVHADLAGSHSDAATTRGFAQLGLGDVETAQHVFREDLAVQGPRPRQLAHLALACFKSGRVVEAQALLKQLQALAAANYVSPDLLAEVHFAGGDVDAGFDALQAALTARVRGLIFLRTNLVLDGLREDPRYIALVAALGL